MQEEIGKELEEKKTELGPKVIEIYEALAAPIKVLVNFENYFLHIHA